MTGDERIDYLERRVVFLESTLVKFMALVLHADRRHGGKTKAQRQAATVGSRVVLEDALDDALMDLLERVPLTSTEQMAVPDPKFLRGRRRESSGGDEG